jgi:hypothetical protein
MATSDESQQIDLGELELPQLQQIKTQLEEVSYHDIRSLCA